MLQLQFRRRRIIDSFSSTSKCGYSSYPYGEADNDAANALYRSLDPDDVGQVVGYTYKVEEKVAVRGLRHVLCA